MYRLRYHPFEIRILVQALLCRGTLLALFYGDCFVLYLLLDPFKVLLQEHCSLWGYLNRLGTRLGAFRSSYEVFVTVAPWSVQVELKEII